MFFCSSDGFSHVYFNKDQVAHFIFQVGHRSEFPNYDFVVPENCILNCIPRRVRDCFAYRTFNTK